MSSNGVDDNRSSWIQRLLRARAEYEGPFSAADIDQALSEMGYAARGGEDGEFLEYTRDGCRGIPVNPDWDFIWADDPIFNCIRRDLGISKRMLLEALNKAKRP